MMKTLSALLAFGLMGAIPAAAQSYPSKTITIVVPASPGGVTDTLARQLALRYDYVWFVPSGAIKEDLLHHSLAALPIASHGPGEPIGIMTRSGMPLSLSAEILLSTIRKSHAG